MQTIDAQQFMQMLQEKDLVLVPRSAVSNDLVPKIPLSEIQRRALRKKWLTVKEIADAKLLPQRSKSGVSKLISDGHIRQSEVVIKGNCRKILTTAVKRLRDEI